MGGLWGEWTMLWGECGVGVEVFEVLLGGLANDCWTIERKRISLKNQVEKRSGMFMVGMGGYTWGWGRCTCDSKPRDMLGASQTSLLRVCAKYMLKSGVRIGCSWGKWGKSSAALREVSWFHRTRDSMMLTMGSWMLGKN